MAAAFATRDPMEDLCEEATCLVCLDYFKDPVSLECGHNFCRSCLNQFWGALATMKTSCPQCKGKILKRNLRPNQPLANIVKIVKKFNLQRPRGTEVCGKHQQPLMLFCKDDETPICVACDRSKEHWDHRRIPLGTAAQDYKNLMSIHQDVLEKEKERILAYKAKTEKEARGLLKQTKADLEKSLGEITQIRQFLEEQEKHLQAKMEELKKQIARERDEHLITFSRELSSLESLIQEMKEKCQQPPAELLQDVRSFLQRCEEKKTLEEPVAFTPELKWKIWEFCDLNSGLVAAMKEVQDALLPGLEFQKANVTLDPGTACSRLILSKDHKSVRYKAKCQDLPDNPERFNNRAYVLGREGFTSGRHFWEVDVGREGIWSVGVVKKSVQRKGPVNICPEEGIWAVGKRADRYHATSHLYGSNFFLSEKTERIRVCLNCASNQVAFYDADTGAQIYVLSSVPFSGETVLPFFYVYDKGYLKISS